MTLKGFEGPIRESRSILGSPAYRHAMEKVKGLQSQLDAARTLHKLGKIIAVKEDYFGQMRT
jgi:hypothetical protein